jgi:hypothetical protein
MDFLIPATIFSAYNATARGTIFSMPLRRDPGGIHAAPTNPIPRRGGRYAARFCMPPARFRAPLRIRKQGHT